MREKRARSSRFLSRLAFQTQSWFVPNAAKRPESVIARRRRTSIGCAKNAVRRSKRSNFEFMMRLKEKYIKEVLPAIKEKFGCKNNLAAARVEKVVVNTGFDPNVRDEKYQEAISNDLSLITGQKPSVRQAKKSIAGFKIREGMPVGMTVTLRKNRMYDFLDRLINVVLPRSRDFRGLPEKNIDQNGNLNIGIKEQIIFPEISTEKAGSIFGIEISVVSSAKSRQEGLELFRRLGFPIIKAESKE